MPTKRRITARRLLHMLRHAKSDRARAHLAAREADRILASTRTVRPIRYVDVETYGGAWKRTAVYRGGVILESPYLLSLTTWRARGARQR